MGLSSLALFVSYNYMEASIASTMLFVYPIMVALIMAVVYHEKLTPPDSDMPDHGDCRNNTAVQRQRGNATLSAAGWHGSWCHLSYSIYIVGE